MASSPPDSVSSSRPWLGRPTERLLALANRQVDAASLGVFRIALGVIGVIAGARFFTHGWIEEYYEKPRLFFSYWGLGWIRPWPAPWMRVHYALMVASAACVALGVRTRIACAVLAVTFGYAHLCDQCNYLNHYYLYTLLAALSVLLPLDRFASLAVLPGAPARTVPAWTVWLLRFQLGVVYVFGALGKVGSDWLVHGQPLQIWLRANAGLPWVGRWISSHAAAMAFSWGGFLFDLCIVPLLLWSRTRRLAYGALLGFHVTTALLFRIGMFPWMMIAFTTVFFSPSWPRRRTRATSGAFLRSGPTLGPRGLVALGVYVLLQVSLPLRSHLYPGNTLWTEEGFRFAWKVMLIEKAGVLELRLLDAEGRARYVDAKDLLTPVQLRMVVTQPDMILQLAHRAAGLHPGTVAVYAETSAVSFNGRPHAPMIDPTVDLLGQRDSLAAKSWILPAPTRPPGH